MKKKNCEEFFPPPHLVDFVEIGQILLTMYQNGENLPLKGLQKCDHPHLQSTLSDPPSLFHM